MPILRRLSLLCGGRGMVERSIEYGRRVIAAEPGDAQTIARIVDYYRRREPAKAEPFLKEVLANPKLEKGSPEALLLEFQLAELYESTGRLAQAADALAKVVDAIDAKAGNALSNADRRRILGDEEAAAYLKFGDLFRKAGRRALALKCFRRAEVYDDANPLIPLLESLVLLDDNKPPEALAAVERALKRQPKGARRTTSWPRSSSGSGARRRSSPAWRRPRRPTRRTSRSSTPSPTATARPATPTRPTPWSSSSWTPSPTSRASPPSSPRSSRRRRPRI